MAKAQGLVGFIRHFISTKAFFPAVVGCHHAFVVGIVGTALGCLNELFNCMAPYLQGGRQVKVSNTPQCSTHYFDYCVAIYYDFTTCLAPPLE